LFAAIGAMPPPRSASGAASPSPVGSRRNS
jgi:hypothetical protein